MNEVLLTVSEVATRLKCHPHTVRRWIWASKLRAVKVGDLVRIPEEEVLRMMRPQQTTSEQSPERGGQALISLMNQFRSKISKTEVQEMERLMQEGEQAADWDDPLA